MSWPFDRELAVERAFGRQRQSSRPLVGDDEAVEPDELDQGCAVVGVQASVEVHLGRSERGEIIDLEGVIGGTRVAAQRDAYGADAAVDLELRVRAPRRARIERERGAQRDRRQAPGGTAQLVGRLRSHLLDDRHDPAERARVKVECHRAARRLRPGVDPPFDRERGAAEIGDGEPLDLEPVGIDPRVDIGVLRLDAGDRSTGDLERERAFARPIERRVAEHGLGESMDAVEIDVGRGERGVEPRRPVVARPDIGESSVDRHAVELELEPLDRDGVAAQPHVAAEAERTGGDGLRIRALGQPGHERARIAGLDPGRSLEPHPAGGGRPEVPAEAQLGQAGRAQLQRLDVQAVGPRGNIGADARKRRAAERHGFDPDAQRRRDRQRQRAGEGLGQRLDGDERAAACRLRQRQHAVEIDLRR